MPSPSNYIDRTGHVYGQLTVTSRGPNHPKNPSITQWNTICSCGNERLVFAGNLQSGGIKTCGQRRHPRE